MNGIDIRMNRLFSRGENAVVVAIDHGMFDGPIPGMIDVPAVAKKIDPCVSAVLMSPGMIRHCGPTFDYKGAPMAILRINWGTVYCFHWQYNDASTVPAMRPSDAVAAGADAVLISLTLNTGSEARDAANVEVYCDLVSEARHLGIPVIGEVFPTRTNELTREELHEQVYTGCRIVAELGADLVKTFYTDKFAEVTASCPLPILGLGAEKTPTQLLALELAEKIVQHGGKGVVFGRNAIQVPDPAAFQRALCAVVQRGTAAGEAVKEYGLRE